jgi:hypothetical protein
MSLFLPALGAAVLLFSSAAFAQTSGHSGHGNAGAAQPRPAPRAEPEQPAPQGAKKPATTSPAFAGYRPYRADEPLVGWREANDLVLQIGGHVGIMKGAAGKEETPGAHGGHHKSMPAGATK